MLSKEAAIPNRLQQGRFITYAHTRTFLLYRVMFTMCTDSPWSRCMCHTAQKYCC